MFFYFIINEFYIQFILWFFLFIFEVNKKNNKKK